jgi:hypothetical protein
MRLLVLLAATLLAAQAAHAERATERYAPSQIYVAHALLERARAAAGLQDLRTAATYAKQAQVDARIAWGMTDAAGLRAEAAQIAADAAAIVTMSNRVPIAASYPSPSGPPPGAAPSPR